MQTFRTKNMFVVLSYFRGDGQKVLITSNGG